jgi:hypothetical protein
MRHEIDAGHPERAAQVFTDYWSHPGHWAALSAGHQAAIARRMPVIHDHFVSLFNDVVTRDDYARLASAGALPRGGGPRRRRGAPRRCSARCRRSVTMQARAHGRHAPRPRRPPSHFLRRHWHDGRRRRRAA